jgi:transcriptional regulator with PAS, ATPase and Fis domain
MSTVALQSLADARQDPFLVVDKDFKIVVVNRAFERAYGTSRERIAGCPCYGISHRGSKPCHGLGGDCPLEQLRRSGARTPYSCVHLRHDDRGRAYYVRLTAYPLKGPDGSLYMGEAVHDLSGPGGNSMVGGSRAFLETVEQLSVAAESDVPVLLTGQTGTGKDLAASFIHQQSDRRNGPFFTLDCTALNENLFESEVFGHERGAFTGSIEKRKGLFELADGGTLFLDEIGELCPTMQAKLLRVLESGEFRRVGGHRILHADVRTVCATNRNITQRVGAGEFRADLFYRIACLSIRLPSLRERMEDIPQLAAAILEHANQSPRRYDLTAEALALLQEYDYPGNVRELRNILLAAAAHTAGARIHASHIAKVLTTGRCALGPAHRLSASPLPSPSPSPTTLRDLESQLIIKLLRKHGGSRRKAATALGVSERTLYRKLNRYKLR